MLLVYLERYIELWDYFIAQGNSKGHRITMNEFKPIACEVEEDKNYFWCSCGKSKKQPFCDGSHVGTDFSPVKYTAEKNEKLCW